MFIANLKCYYKVKRGLSYYKLQNKILQNKIKIILLKNLSL